MARVSIYVSDDLKARMAEAGDALNWSDIARPAFENAIANHNHRKGRNMSTMIERLRASKVRHEQDQDDDAKQRGRGWATDRAEFAELKQVADIDLDQFGKGLNSIFKAIHDAVDPDDTLETEDLCETLFGDAVDHTDTWLIAWVEGAQEAFAEVKDQI